jgi:hypothetical protein
VILLVHWTNPTLVAVMSAGTAFVTTVLSTPLRYLIDKRALQHKLETEYEYEQRRELRQLIGRYHGRLVEAADGWRNRMENLFKHEADGHLDAGGRYENPDYYFASTVHRFLVLCSLARLFEAEAFFIDARIGEPKDLHFVRFVKAFRWAMTDLELIEGLEYDAWAARDHFLTDRFRVICDACAPDGKLVTLPELEARAGHDPVLEPVFRFFDGLRADEPRLRWDRLVALDLLVLAFLNVVGYELQRSTDADFARAAACIRNPAIRRNLLAAVGRFGLADQPAVRPLVGALAEDEPASTESERSRALVR